jgi:hypothetical protein
MGGAVMPVTVKSISLWRKEVQNQAGTLAQTLEPVTKAGANLRVLMGYRYPGDGTRAVIELYPIAGKRVTDAAAEARLEASSIPTTAAPLIKKAAAIKKKWKRYKLQYEAQNTQQRDH